MTFSFADVGFWRIAAVSLVLEILHLGLESHWPAIQGSRLGPRPVAAKVYMLTEFVVLIAVLAAAIGSITRMFRIARRPTVPMARVVTAALGLLGIFLFVWQR